MELTEHIEAIDRAVADARRGLPRPVFDLVSRLTPLVNVDVLVRNDKGETLLTWRSDEFYRGWHIPGGVIRFKEQMADRIAEVARIELGAAVAIVGQAPVAVTPIMHPVRLTRGHFISFLFECALTSPLDESRRHAGGELMGGQWAWHSSCPSTIIPQHEIYRRFIGQQS
jgi:ADP-ribose pyrophosphatase YjhB (NUDIX family)